MRNFLLFLSLGLITMNGNFAFSHVSPPSIARTAKIKNEVTPQLEKKYRMHLCGSGGAMPDGIVSKLTLSFEIKRALTIEDARPILVDCVGAYVKAVNADAELKPYLKTSPFAPKNIEINIFFWTQDMEVVADPFLSVATAINGKLIYCTEEKDQKFGYKSEVIESYEDAVKILKEKKNTPQ